MSADSTVLLLILLASSVIAAFAFTTLNAANRRQTSPAGQFGEADKRNYAAAERKALLAAFLAQQRWAFALVWIAAALSVLLGAIVISRVLVAQRIDLATVSAAAGLAGNLWLGKHTWDLYAAASQRLEALLSGF
jgi:hypothetical protein